jgi:hypothetical protein
MAAIFGIFETPPNEPIAPGKEPVKTISPRLPQLAQGPHAVEPDEIISDTEPAPPVALQGILTNEEAAVYEIRAIPLYFPMSYSLVKPYIKGFETNSLDAPILKEISIDNGWRPKMDRQEP